MNRELAESYVRYGINSTIFTKKNCTAFLPFNILFLLISVALFQQLYFNIVVVLIIIVAIITSMLFRMKWSAFMGLLSQATQFVIFVISIDCIYFGMYHLANMFVWLEFIISMIVQIVAFVVNFFLAVSSAKRHVVDKKPRVNAVAGAVAGLTYAGALIFCKIFLTEATLSIAMTILSFLMNIMVCLLSYVVSMAMYRAYLIKKYNLEIQLDKKQSD